MSAWAGRTLLIATHNAGKLEEMRALFAPLGITVTGAAEHGLDTLATLTMPDLDATVAPLVYALPIQLIAYHTAVFMGKDVDQPRNLAKSVTVE